MKNGIVTMAFCALSLAGYSQAMKGDRLVGAQVANINFRSASGGDLVSGQLSPTVGWLVSDRTVVGIGVPIYLLSYTSGPQLGGTNSTKTSIFQLGLAPFIRQYLNSGMTRPYLGGGLTYATTSVSSKSGTQTFSDSNNSGIGYNLSLGVAFFLNRHISLDVAGMYSGDFDKSNPAMLLGSSNANILGSLGGNSFTLGVGFNIFLPGRGQ
ncbi:outer membrane beta-barrel protein [Fibrella sp. HMF5335]|uniref:Outer membrane beta-barrel protein n=1 Tax=Fibrella rubiginis TaxID=2817060 RepID=A0A939GK19_9BACT|nr:outer membrane beta-barrel protein [Fibrella rubiginis]MBO0938855.1 outer membrane beta-barrel protein [Fibrella rubiginis]